jgi:hypothetical protein
MKCFKKILSTVLTFSLVMSIMGSMMTTAGASSVTRQARIIFDSTNPRDAATLRTDFEIATAAFRTRFRLDFNLYMVSRDNALNGNLCPRHLNDICVAQCGTLPRCNSPLTSNPLTTGHHRSGGRLITISSQSNVHTVRIVGHRLCWRNHSGEHQLVGGLGERPGRNTIVSTRLVPVWYIHGTIQHELSHNLGAEHCENFCIMGPVLNPDRTNVWCDTCARTINGNI